MAAKVVCIGAIDDNGVRVSADQHGQVAINCPIKRFLAEITPIARI
jgi:hypothetical protein